MGNKDRQQRLDALRLREAQGILTEAERAELEALFAALDAEETEAMRPALERMQGHQAELQREKEQLGAEAAQLERAVESGEACIIERDSGEYAVLVSAREWRQRNPEPARNDPPPYGAQDENDQERRLREIGAKLDALGPEYRLSPEKQARAEELLSKGNTLSRAERRELRALLRECDAIMLRRAEALDRVG
jgi:hypothetical protein